jgi:predicted metal-binding membrane protein
MIANAVEAMFRRDTLVVIGALVTLTLLAWIAVFAGAGTGMDPVAMSGWFMPLELPPELSSAWRPADWLIAFAMWAAMMVAMMLPSASPTILLYARVARQAEAEGKATNAAASIIAFAIGYVAVWSLFSLLAVALQWGLEQQEAMSAMMSSRIALLSGALLIVAGTYQLSPLKFVCLRHCRAPASFIASHWRKGVLGGFRMGLAHGLYCLGCCAALMLLLFVGGVMNLVWIAGLTIVVAIEKLAPYGDRMGKALAALLLVGGTLLIVADWI